MSVSLYKSTTMKNSEKLHKESKLVIQNIINAVENETVDSLNDKKLDKLSNDLMSNNNLNNHLSNYESFSSQEGYKRFLNTIENIPIVALRKRISIKLWIYSAAASVLIIIGFSLYLMRQTKSVNQDVINPGIAKSTLILSNGEEITASSDDFVYEKQNVKVEYQKGSFSYAGDVSADSLSENILVVPMGGEANMVLSDGTKVWLNADSYLKHPAKFAGNTREVTVKGEVYFEVAEDKEHPFIVHTPKGDVKVLGTGFGITAYPEENAYVTLAHGKIAFNDNVHSELVLSPGEQIKVSGNQLEKRKVNVAEYVGWKDGEFTFHQRSLEEIMNTMQRWYNVEVVFDNPELKNIRFSGDLKRYESINVLLNALSLTKEMNYSIEDNVITLYKR